MGRKASPGHFRTLSPKLDCRKPKGSAIEVTHRIREDVIRQPRRAWQPSNDTPMMCARGPPPCAVVYPMNARQSRILCASRRAFAANSPSGPVAAQVALRGVSRAESGTAGGAAVRRTKIVQDFTCFVRAGMLYYVVKINWRSCTDGTTRRVHRLDA